jgi:hypothetical protein
MAAGARGFGIAKHRPQKSLLNLQALTIGMSNIRFG